MAAADPAGAAAGLVAAAGPSGDIRFHSPAVFSQVAKAAGIDPTEGSVTARRTKPQLICETLAWCLMVMALARPQFVEPPIEKVEPQLNKPLVPSVKR